MHSSIAANFSNGRFVIELFQDLKRGTGKNFFKQAHGENHFTYPKVASTNARYKLENQLFGTIRYLSCIVRYVYELEIWDSLGGLSQITFAFFGIF